LQNAEKEPDVFVVCKEELRKQLYPGYFESILKTVLYHPAGRPSRLIWQNHSKLKISGKRNFNLIQYYPHIFYCTANIGKLMEVQVQEDSLYTAPADAR
jgi:hypothetical protein